jgi:hypothetical protein
MAVTEKYLPRLVDDLLATLITQLPALLIVGPRATGKTTTAERLARTVVALDQPAQAAVVRLDPDAVVRGLAEPILIDEWEVAPEILGAVKRAVDREPRSGRFLVTGSVRGDLDSENWPGTGRLVRVDMSGLTVAELEGHVTAVPLLDRLADGDLGQLTAPGDRVDIRDYLAMAARGGFPELALRTPPGLRGRWLRSYVDQVLTRDLAGLSPRRDPDPVRRYLEAYALNTAGVVDQRSLMAGAGVARATADASESVLSNLLMIARMPAWWTNRLKRLAKSPKRFIMDPAVAMSIINITPAGLMRDANLLGRILETFVVAQVRAELSRCETLPRLYHLRQEDGRREVDLIVEYGVGRILGIEIKATSAPSPHDARHLGWLRDQLGDRFVGGLVLHTGPRVFALGDRIIAAPISCLWTA